MAASPFLAHIADDGREQTAASHLTGTALLAKNFARPFDGAEQAELAEMAHDIGKYSAAFQKRLRGDPARVDLSTAGALECCKISQFYAAIAVAGHHGSLSDVGSPRVPEDSTFWGRMKRAQSGRLEPYDSWKTEIRLPQAPFPDFIGKGALEDAFFIRMLYSCLVDADYLDTAAFMSGHQREPDDVPMDDLWNRLGHYISNWFLPKGELNRRRCEILAQCIHAGTEQERGLFSLTVPTGGGKTVASLAFALAHAKAQGLRRVIYVIPYTSIIEQTADVFREVLEDEYVLEIPTSCMIRRMRQTVRRSVLHRLQKTGICRLS